MLRCYPNWMFKSRRRIFNEIYSNNSWGNSESISGDGSTISYTKNLRENFPKLLSEFRIQTVLDGACGDFNWMSRIAQEFPSVNFVGVDIVPKLVATNRIKYSHLKNCTFGRLDIAKDPLPVADLMIVRDCLFHLSFESIKSFLYNFQKSEIQYLLTTSHHESQDSLNVDIRDGEFRQLFLLLSPFNLPRETLFELEDWVPPHPQRSLYLWSRSSIKVAG
jgi:hypothetical protein